MFTEKFNKCIEIILKLEGYHSNDKNDKGGETYFGLCEKFEPNEVALMRKMTEDEARDFATKWYYEHYWLALYLETYETKLALVIFNLAEAIGINGVKRWLIELQPNVTIERLLLRAVEERARRCNEDPTQKVFLLGWINGIITLWKTNFPGF